MPNAYFLQQPWSVTLTTCVAFNPLVAPVIPMPTRNVPAYCEGSTRALSVVQPCAPDAIVSALLPIDCSQPHSTDAP